MSAALPGDRDAIARLVPHAGRMVLWQRVLECTPDAIALQAFDHGDAAHPLRRAGRLHALHLCEYGAQAMAVHGGLLASRGGGAARPGLLVALRGVQLHCTRIDTLDGPLEGRAEVLVQGDTGWQYAFTVHHAGALLAEGRAAVIHPA